MLDGARSLVVARAASLPRAIMVPNGRISAVRLMCCTALTALRDRRYDWLRARPGVGESGRAGQPGALHRP